MPIPIQPAFELPLNGLATTVPVDAVVAMALIRYVCDSVMEAVLSMNFTVVPTGEPILVASLSRYTSYPVAPMTVDQST